MKAAYQFFIILALLFSQKGCEEMSLRGENVPLNQQYFFLYEYINYAWGYQHHGWIIDSAGIVRYYDVPDKWILPSTDAAIELAGIENYATRSDSVLTTVDRSELIDMVGLIHEAARGTYSDSVNVMADAGSWSYYALEYHEDKDTYERILLRIEGDWQVENLSDAADELYQWMKEIQRSIAGQ